MEDHGNNQWLIENQQSHKTYYGTVAQSAAHLLLVCVLFLVQVSPISCITTCPKGACVHLSLNIMPTLNYTQTTLY